MIRIPVAWLRPIGLFLLIFGSPMWFYLGWKDYSEQKAFLDEGEVTSVTILEVEERCAKFTYVIFSYTDCAYLATYQYEVNNTPYLAEDEKLQKQKTVEFYRNKSQGEIYYLPDTPSKSLLTENRIPSWQYFSMVLQWAGTSGLIGAWKFNKRGMRRTRLENLFFFSVPLIAYFTVAVFILSVDRLKDNFMEQAIAIFVVVIGIIFLAALVPIAALQTFQKNILRAQSSNVTSKNIMMPTNIRPLWDSIRGLGFTRLCEISKEVQGAGAQFQRFFSSPDGRVTALIIDKSGMVGFLSFFGEETILQTTFPLGQNLDAPHYRSRFCEESVEIAYQFHLNEVLEFEQKYGKPLLIENIGHIIHWDKIDNQKHSTPQLKIIKKQIFMDMIGVGILLLFLGSYFLVKDRMSDEVLRTYLLVGFLPASFAVVIPNWIKNHKRTIWQ